MKRLLSILIMASAMLITQAQEKVLFKLNPEKGKTYNYEMSIKTDVEGPQTVIMDMLFKMGMSIAEVQDTTVTLQAKYNFLRTDVNTGMMTISYDSSKEPSNSMEEMMASQLKPLLENTLTVKMNKFGKIIDADFPNVPEQAFDKSSLSGLAVEFPQHSLAIGDSWNISKEVPQMNAKILMKTTFTEKTTDGYKFTTAGDIIDSTGKSIGTATGYSIVDSTSFMNKLSVSETSMELQGSKVTASVELRLVQ